MDRHRFVGGLRTFFGRGRQPRLWEPGANFTRPLAELRIADGVVHVRARSRVLRSLSFGLGDFQAPIKQLRAEPFGELAVTRGVLLTTEDGRSAIFWCSKRVQRQVLEALRDSS